MNGKILIPPSSSPIVPPSPGYLILWVAQDGTFKSMDADGNVKNLANTAIEDLIDVSVSSPVEGEVFTYDAGIRRWINKPIDLGDIDLSSIENSVNVNAINIASIIEAVTSNSTDIDNAEQEILSNTSLLNSNTLSIGDLESSVSGHSTLLSAHTDDISSNSNDLNLHTSRLNTVEQSVAEVQESINLVDTALGIVDSAVTIVATATDENDARLVQVEGNISTLENNIDGVELLANTAQARADEAYTLAENNQGGSPGDPVDPSSLIDENDTAQAEAIDGFLKVNNRLTFAGPSIRIGEGTGESDSPAGVGGEIAIGKNACFGAGSKTNGIGIGVQSLYNTSGTANIGIGLNSGNGNSGNYNVNIGNSAGQYRIISSSNINIGYASGYNGRGNDNVYLGNWAGSVAASNSIIENKMLRIGTKGGAAAEFLDKELIIGNMDPDVDGGQWLLVNGNLRLKSPNGNQWTIKVDDSGNISADAVS